MEQTSLLGDPAPLDLSALPDGLWVGTSSFSSPDWVGGFYPSGAKPGAFLTHYARQLRTVEIDATWHAMPRRETVEGWERKVGEGFRFALKVPKVVTHEKELVGCEREWEQFYALSELLGPKRGPLLLQFPYWAKGKDAEEYRTGARFLDRLSGFLERLPAEGRYAVEVRNEKWIAPPLLELLKSHGVALALIAYYTMPTAARLPKEQDVVTADFGYVRFLGHHREMDKLVAENRQVRGKKRSWDELVVDRTDETRAWIPALQDLMARTDRVYVYYNNHYAGHAPGSIELLNSCWPEAPSG